MATPVRYPSGIATRKITHPMGAFGYPDPSQWINYFNDFLGDSLLTAFTITEDSAGATQVIATDEGGIAKLTTAAADNDTISLQLTTAPYRVAISTGKKAIFGIKFRVVNPTPATPADLLFGLTVVDTTPIADAGGSTITDGIYFAKAATGTAMRLEVANGGTVTASATLATIAENTYTELAFVYDGVDTISAYLNGALVFDQTTLTNMPTSADALTLTIAMNSAAAEAQVLDVDWVLAAVER